MPDTSDHTPISLVVRRRPAGSAGGRCSEGTTPATPSRSLRPPRGRGRSGAVRSARRAAGWSGLEQADGGDGGESLAQPDGLRAEVLGLGSEQVERADDLAAQPHRQGMHRLDNPYFGPPGRSGATAGWRNALAHMALRATPGWPSSKPGWRVDGKPVRVQRLARRPSVRSVGSPLTGSRGHGSRPGRADPPAGLHGSPTGGSAGGWRPQLPHPRWLRHRSR
jgi:hypothetical protein